MKRKIVKRTVIALIIIFILLLGAYIIINTMLSFTAYSRYDALCAKAHDYYDEYVKNWIDNGRDKFLDEYGWEDGEGYYATCFVAGKLQCVLYSLSKPDNSEIKIPVKEHEIEKLCNVFTQYKAIGYYCPENDRNN